MKTLSALKTQRMTKDIRYDFKRKFTMQIQKFLNSLNHRIPLSFDDARERAFGIGIEGLNILQSNRALVESGLVTPASTAVTFRSSSMYISFFSKESSHDYTHFTIPDGRKKRFFEGMPEAMEMLTLRDEVGLVIETCRSLGQVRQTSEILYEMLQLWFGKRLLEARKTKLPPQLIKTHLYLAEQEGLLRQLTLDPPPQPSRFLVDGYYREITLVGI